MGLISRVSSRTYRMNRACSGVIKRRLHQFQCVVVGAGLAGLPMTYKLNKYFKSRFYVAMIDPQEYHSYQPLWTLVGGGQRPFKDSQRKFVEVVDKETMWHQNFVTEFNPDKNKIKMLDGTELEYKQLIVAMGLQLNWDKIPGLSQAIELKTPNVCSNYSAFTVERTWQNIQEITKKA